MSTTNLRLNRKPDGRRFTLRRLRAVIAIGGIITAMPLWAATNDLTSLLQRGLFEEEANRNLDAAIANYQSLAGQFDRDRQVAATAIFRLGECYRKLSRTDDAVTQYERILREFGDQQSLVTLSRQNLAGLGKSPQIAAPATVVSPSSASRAQQRQLLELEIQVMEKKLSTLEPLVERGVASVDGLTSLQRELLGLKRQLVALSDEPSTAVTTDDEQQEIRRIRLMIQNSPDLINAPDNDSSTPLHRAASKGQLVVARFLLDSGANVNQLVNQSAPIHIATRNGHKAMVELLLDHGADVNLLNGERSTPLHLAVRYRFKAVTDVLIAHEAAINARDNSGTTALHLAAQNGDYELLKLLLDRGAQVNAANLNGSTPLHYAANKAEIVKSLVATGATVNALNKAGETPLLVAAKDNKDAALIALLAASADPNLVPPGGNRSALFRAVGNRSQPAVDALLAAKAQVNVIDGEGLTPISVAVKSEEMEIAKKLLAAGADPNAGKRDAPLAVAIDYVSPPQKAAFCELLLSHGADPNKAMVLRVNNSLTVASGQYSSGSSTPPISPIQLAVARNQPDTTTVLLDHKANANANGSSGEPLLIQAVKSRNLDLVETLLAHGAEVNATGYNGWTALHYVAASPHREMVELLLANKASVNARNTSGETPLDIAKQAMNQDLARRPGYEETEAILRRNGALDDVPDFSSIRINRVGFTRPVVVFSHDTNNWNRYTLIESLMESFSWNIDPMHVSPAEQNPLTRSATWAFPDFSRIVVHRLNPKGDIAVNLLNATNGIDCSKDMWVEFGDVIEVPFRDHPLNNALTAMTRTEFASFRACLQRDVQLVVHGQNRTLTLQPKFPATLGTFYLNDTLRTPTANSWLLSSSDLSRVKVTRKDPKSGKSTDFLVDASVPNSPIDLWLRAGDVINVTEKPL